MHPYYRRLFLPTGTGFHFSGPVPPDLASSRYLQSEDPEDVICSVLAYAQAGQFAPCSRLLDLMARHDDADVWGACSTLLSFAAPRTILQDLVPLAERLRTQRGTDAPLQWVGETLAKSHESWVVPVILRLFEQIQSYDQYMALPVHLSLLLEPKPAGIDSGPRRLQEANLPDWYEPTPAWGIAEYTRMVEARYAELITALPTTDYSCLFDGELLTVRQVASRALDRIKRTSEENLRVTQTRMLLEAYTGEDFSGFYEVNEHRFLPLHASTRLEAFLEDVTADRFMPGKRYFFGHPVPDR